MSAVPNPALKKKVLKVLETKTDEPDFLSCLEELSEFYDNNTLAARRNLRSSIEKRGVDVSLSFLSQFELVKQRLDEVDNDVQSLAQSCTAMAERLSACQSSTRHMMTMGEQLQKEESALKSQLVLSTALTDRLLLSEEQKLALSSETLTPDFFSALSRAAKIEEECKQLLRAHYQRAVLEVLDTLSLTQEAAYERLFRWLQNECAVMDSDSPEVAPILRQAVVALTNRPQLFKLFLEEVGVTRRNAVLQRFVLALSRGSGSRVRPIDFHAHEPLRYVGDMLAWVHQSLASERELLEAMLSPVGALATEGDKSKEDSEASTEDFVVDIGATLDHIFDGVCRPLIARIRQVKAPGAGDLSTSYRLASLLQFYVTTLSGLMRENAVLPAALAECHSDLQEAFFRQLHEQGQSLVRSTTTCPFDLTPPPALSKFVTELGNIMAHCDSSLVTSLQREDEFAPILDSALDAIMRAIVQCTKRLDPSDAAVFMTNCLCILHGVLSQYDFASERTHQLSSEIEASLKSLESLQVAVVLNKCGLHSKQLIMAEAPADTPLSTVEGLDEASMAASVKAFHAAVFSLGASALPVVTRIVSQTHRVNTRQNISKSLAEMYQKVFEAMSDRRNKYPNAEAILVHTPEQIRTILDC